MASSIGGQDRELPSSFGSEGQLEKDDAVSRKTLFHLQAHPGDNLVGKLEAHFAAKLKTLTAWLEKEGQAINRPTAGTA